MEVGAVKQAFNNEVILLKKKLNQAKIQVIHKLTRKAKTFTEKKAPDHLKEKLKRKAESAINEVLLIKKIKAKDIAKFMVTHKGELKDYLNKPNVDEEKACARLLLHKALEDKYSFFRGRFSNVPIQDLFMSRLERRKMKKEAKEKKKKGKDSKVVNSEGDWNVEDVEKGSVADSDDDKGSGDGSGDESEGPKVNKAVEECDDELTAEENDNSNDSQLNDAAESDSEDVIENNSDKQIQEEIKVTPKVTKPGLIIPKLKKTIETLPIKGKNKATIKKAPKEHKNVNKNKNLNEKLIQRKFKKSSEAAVIENKIVDPFFITSTGENYMSVVEPRQPDEVKEVHRQGNRKLRRAVMFGHVPKIKPRQDNYRQDNNYNRQKDVDKVTNFRNNDFGKGNNYRNKFNNDNDFNDDKRSFNGRDDRFKVEKEEKLHPSWEAKKKKSGILPFEGKKIVFDDS